MRIKNAQICLIIESPRLSNEEKRGLIQMPLDHLKSLLLLPEYQQFKDIYSLYEQYLSLEKIQFDYKKYFVPYDFTLKNFTNRVVNKMRKLLFK